MIRVIISPPREDEVQMSNAEHANDVLASLLIRARQILRFNPP